VQLVRKKTFQMFLMVFSQLAILTYMGIRIYYAYSVFDYIDEMYYWKNLREWSFGIATLIACLTTNQFLCSILEWSKLKVNIFHVIIIIINALLYGGDYLLGTANDKDQEAYNLMVRTWAGFDTYWFLFFFVYNIVPMVVIVWKITDMSSPPFWEHIQLINKYDQWFFRIIFSQFFYFALYFVVRFLQTNTLVLRNDRNFLAMDSIRAFCISISTIMLCVLISRVRIVVKSTKSGHTSSTAGKSTASKSMK
jgi:hypothetical protein